MTTFELLHKSRAVKLFELSTVLTFGALLTLVTVMTELATVYAGNTGAYALAAISGFADVDAIILSVSRLEIGELSADVAARANLIVVAVNTFSKALGMHGGRGRNPQEPFRDSGRGDRSRSLGLLHCGSTVKWATGNTCEASFGER